MVSLNKVAAPVTLQQVAIMADNIVRNDVRYCVSFLVSAMLKGAFEEGALLDEDDAFKLATRAPDESDYEDAARDAGVLDRITVYQDDFKVWSFITKDEDGDEDDRGTADGTEAGAWRAAFEAMNLEHPDGSDILEHWLVTEDLARRLEAKGESVARDVQGLTIWGRVTSGQGIAADYVIQSIARDILEA